MSRIFSFFLFVLAVAAEPADTIWSARYVITMDAQRRVIENGAVAIKGDRILAVGKGRDRRALSGEALNRPTPSGSWPDQHAHPRRDEPLPRHR
jgi:hypothetical protein